MSTVTITAITPQPPLQVQEGDTVTFRGWYSNSFVGADGVTPIEGGNGQTGFFYEWGCELNDDGFVVIPAIEIQPTTESNPTAGFFGALFVNGSFSQMIIGTPQATAGWQIPTIYGPTMNFGQLALYNAAVQLLFASNSFFTQNQTILEIQLLAGQFLYAAVGINGIAQASYPPLVASEPIFLSTTDPTRILGAIGTAGIVPRSDDVNSLVNSQIADDGTNVSVVTLNYFQAGDVNFVQNGSRIDVSDNAGRAEIFAGGNGQAEYAGMVGSCVGTNPAEVFVQATGYSYLYGSAGVVNLGDGEVVNNGTYISIDDMNRVIKLFTLPTSDPAIENALWRDGNVLMISNG